MRGVLISLILIAIGMSGCNGGRNDTPLVPLPTPPISKAYPLDINFTSLPSGPITGTVNVSGVDVSGQGAVVDQGTIELNPGELFLAPPGDVSEVAVMIKAQSQSSVITGLDQNNMPVSTNFTWKLGDYYFFTISTGSADIHQVQVSGPDSAVQRVIFSNPNSFIDFEAVGVISMANSASDMLVADLDGDGKTDIAVVSPADSLIHVAYGDGAGGFARDETIHAAGTPGKIAAADIDGDTLPDLMLTVPDSGLAQVFKNEGGAFDSGVTYSVGASPAAIAIADISGNAPDIAVAGADGVGILPNNGDGTFGSLQPVPGLNGPALDLALADVDLDRKTDLIVALPSSIQVWIGDGAGGFTAPGSSLTIPITQTVKKLAALTLDWDKYPDIVAIFTSSPNFSSWLYDKSGTFIDSQTFDAVSGAAADLALADINSDGFADMVVADGTSGKLSLYIGLLMGQFQPVKNIGDGPSPVIIRAGDLDKDRRNDIMTLDSSGNLRIYLNRSY